MRLTKLLNDFFENAKGRDRFYHVYFYHPARLRVSCTDYRIQDIYSARIPGFRNSGICMVKIFSKKTNGSDKKSK